MRELNFLSGFDIKQPSCVGLAGSGGKTTLLIRLAKEAIEKGFKVLVTTTTHIQNPFPLKVDEIFLSDSNSVSRIQESFDKNSSILFVKCQEGNKWKGVPPDVVEEFLHHADFIFVEADGSRGRSFKAPNSTEPVFPKGMTLAIVVFGLDAIDKPLSEIWAHRLQNIIQTTRLNIGDPITKESVIKVLTHPSHYLQKIPLEVPSYLYLSKYRSRENIALELANKLPPRTYSSVFAGEIEEEGGFIVKLK